MVTDPYEGDTDRPAPGDDLAARAVTLAQRWITESAEVDVDPAAERLAGVLKDPNGLPFTIASAKSTHSSACGGCGAGRYFSETSYCWRGLRVAA